MPLAPPAGRRGALQRRSTALAAFGCRPFTAQEALAAGLTRDDLRSASVKRLARGVFVQASTPTTLPLRVRAALLLAPEGTRAGSVTAAELLGLPVPHSDKLHFWVPPRTRWAFDGTVLGRREWCLRAPERVLNLHTASGVIPVSGPVVAMAESVEHLTFVDAVVLADAVLARPDVDAETACALWAEHRELRRIAAAATPLSESPMETRLRLLLELAGLPKPFVQHRVWIEGRERRFDLAYPDAKVAVEYDGGHHFASEAAKHEDAVRREAAERAGWAVVSVVPHGVYRDPAGTVARVAKQLEARGRRTPITDGWRAHFPQRA